MYSHSWLCSYWEIALKKKQLPSSRTSTFRRSTLASSVINLLISFSFACPSCGEVDCKYLKDELYLSSQTFWLWPFLSVNQFPSTFLYPYFHPKSFLLFAIFDMCTADIIIYCKKPSTSTRSSLVISFSSFTFKSETIISIQNTSASWKLIMKCFCYRSILIFSLTQRLIIRDRD